MLQLPKNEVTGFGQTFRPKLSPDNHLIETESALDTSLLLDFVVSNDRPIEDTGVGAPEPPLGSSARFRDRHRSSEARH